MPVQYYTGDRYNIYTGCRYDIFMMELLLHAKQPLDCASIKHGKLQTARTAIKLYLAMLGRDVPRPVRATASILVAAAIPGPHCGTVLHVRSVSAASVSFPSLSPGVWNGGAGSKPGEARWLQSKIFRDCHDHNDGQSLTAGREEQDRAKRVL